MGATHAQFKARQEEAEVTTINMSPTATNTGNLATPAAVTPPAAPINTSSATTMGS